MGAEKINQIEYEIGKNLNCNLKTGRLLFQTNVVNIFKDEYNLNLNLIYNSKCDNDSNINAHLGSYFRLDICEYIKRIDTLMYYIDSFDRYHLAETYCTSGNEIYKRFDDESKLTLIAYTDNDDKILIRDSSENELEFHKLHTQSSNTMYYVLTKKTIKFKENSTISYNYKYDLDDRLISIYCSTDVNRKINFKYNDQGRISHIYINHNNKINGVKLKYNNQFKIVAINSITNSIEEIKYLFSYGSNNRLHYLANYKKQVAYHFEYNSTYKLTSARYGSASLNIQETNDLYASEDLYAKNQIIYNYPKDNDVNYDISSITISEIGGYDFTYDGSENYTLVTKVNTLNSTNNIKRIYYYDSRGSEISYFEVINNNTNILKNTDIMQGIELLGNGSSGTIINGKNAYTGQCSYTYNNIDSNALSEFIAYHNANISRFNQSTLVYYLSVVVALDLVYENNFIYLRIQYSDYDYEEEIVRIRLKQSTQLQFFSEAIDLKKKEITNIQYKIFSSNSSNHYVVSNMYLRFGSSELIQLKNEYTNLYKIDQQLELKLLKLGNSTYTYYTLGEEYYLSKNDIIKTYQNMLKSANDFDLYMNDGKIIERAITASIKFRSALGVDEYVEIDDNFNVSVQQNDFNSNLIIETSIKFKDVAPINNITLTNVIEYATSVSNGNVTNYQYKYCDLKGQLILEKDEYGMVKRYIYDNYNRPVTTYIYDGTTLIKTINNTYNNLYEIEDDGFNYVKRVYSSEGLLSKIGEKSVNDNSYLENYYIYDTKNRIQTYSDKLDNSNYVNHIRYNDKDEIIEEYVKNNSNIINHFYTYDNYNRPTNYYKLNKLGKNTQDNPKVSYSYDDSQNVETETIYMNNYNIEVLKYVYDKYGRLIEINDANNTNKVVYNYNITTDLLSYIQDNYKATRFNYYYDASNNVNKIVELDSNNNEILKIEKEEYNTHKKIKYSFSNNEIYYNYYHSMIHLISPRLTNISNNYFSKTITYNNNSSVSSNTITISDNGGNYTDYQVIQSNTYLTYNNQPTNLKNFVLFSTFSNPNIVEYYNFGYLYANKCNNISSYVLEKKLNNTFINKFEYAYNFKDSKELTQDKLFRYNSSDSIISYKENNYTYDKLGNITSVNKKTGTNPNNITSNITNSYTYTNTLLTRIDNSYDNSYKTYEYDNYGNIITINHYDSNDNLIKQKQFTYIRKSLIETYKVYNQYNELILSYKYYYNYNNVRYKKENMINHTITTFNVLNSKIISDSRGIIYLYDENDELIGFNYNNKTYFYIKDETGNIVSIINDGKEKVRYIYDGYGNTSVYEVNSNNELVINNNSSFIGNINPYRYKTYYFDTESKLYYLNSRYYSSDIGRFISPDDISYLDSNIINGLNLYCYCLNNPIIYSDPEGCFAWLVFAIVLLLAFTPIGGTALQVTTSTLSYIGLAVASIFDDEIRSDMNAIGWNPFNSNENSVLKSKRASFYKGVPVFKTKNSRSGSFGAIFLSKYDDNVDDVRHERGHNWQLMMLGIVSYATMIGLPSMFEWSSREYYDRPWEITADSMGGTSRTHIKSDINRGYWYLLVSSLLGPFGYIFLLWEN